MPAAATRASRPRTGRGAYVERTGRLRNRIGLLIGLPLTSVLSLSFGLLAARGFAGGPLQPGEVQAPNGVLMAGCAVITIGMTLRLVLRASSIWYGDWRLAVDAHGVWLPGPIPWREITELAVGRAGDAAWHVDDDSRALVEGIDDVHRRHAGGSPEAPLSARSFTVTLPPEPVLVTVTLRPGAPSEAATFAGHLAVVRHTRGAAADELAGLADRLRSWRRGARRRYTHAYLCARAIDRARFDAAVRRFAPTVPVRRVDAPAAGPAATPVQVAALLADAARRCDAGPPVDDDGCSAR